MIEAARWQPASPGERIRFIDGLRGMALFGVLMVNLLCDFRVPLLEHILRPAEQAGWADRWVEWLSAGLLEFKAITIFSFLFGVGVAIQSERAGARGVSPRWFLVRRMGWLAVLGCTHLLFLWNGDILALYGVCGALLIPCIRMSWPGLLVIGAVLMRVPDVVPFGLSLPSGDAADSLIAQARQVYSTGGVVEIMAFRWQETRALIVPLLVGVLPRTAGLMFWGMAAWRGGILREPEKHRGLLWAAFAGCGTLGVAATAEELWAKAAGRPAWPPLDALSGAAVLLLAVGYVSGLLLWWRPGRAAWLSWFSAAGQMALTNYLVQSVVLSCVFYGYGFGLFGRLGSAAAAGIGLALYAAQLAVSRVWLRRFRYGPCEWLWRSLSYGRRQPWREF
jgi:uncharacterized protein